jgi:hypothetical protein
VIKYYTTLPDNKNKIFGGAYGVHDTELVKYRDMLIKQFTELDSADPAVAEQIKTDFFKVYQHWLFDGFNFVGTELYQYACFTQGTTESFAQFYIRYRKNHRLRIARGEYFYHQMMKSLWYNNNFAWLDEDQMRSGDVLLISVPFADTGDIPIGLDQLLDDCDRLEVPVMLDLAYLNLTVGSVFDYKIDLSRPCIKYVVSSLSKAFPVENLRIGIRLQKTQYEDQLYVVNEKNYNYINLLSAYVGTGMMKKFPSDYIFNRYRQQQLELCSEMELSPAPCFNFGIDYKNNYPIYNRGNTSNRLCFSRLWDGRGEKFNLES